MIFAGVGCIYIPIMIVNGQWTDVICPLWTDVIFASSYYNCFFFHNTINTNVLNMGRVNKDKRTYKFASRICKISKLSLGLLG